jgi:hypothetical protein
MNRWEYLTLKSSQNYGTTKFYVNDTMQSALKNQKLADVINQIGGQGWELVGITNGGADSTYVFKRPTNVQAPAPK